MLLVLCDNFVLSVMLTGVPITKNHQSDRARDLVLLCVFQFFQKSLSKDETCDPISPPPTFISVNNTANVIQDASNFPSYQLLFVGDSWTCRKKKSTKQQKRR